MAVEVLKLQKAVASSYVKTGRANAASRKHRQKSNTAIVTEIKVREGEINWQHVKEHTGEHR